MSRKKHPLGDLVGLVEKRFGKGALMNLGADGVQDVPAFSTGSLSLDHVLGVGGLPYGRIIEIYGPEASGKTTLTLHAVAEVQRAGGTAAFIDAEHALDPAYARSLGVDLSSLLLSQPDCGEQALDIAEVMASSEAVDLIVIDSVAALTPRAEIEGDMGAMHVGLQARMMSQGLRKLTAAAHRNGTAIVFINQLRQKIGVTFGNPETTTGGNALKFYASVRLDIRRVATLKGAGEDPIGNRTRVKVAKNKLAPPFRRCEFDIVYGRGICQAGEALDLGLELGLVQKSGAWLSFGDERLGQGRENARNALLLDPALFERLRTAVREAKPASATFGGPAGASEAEDGLEEAA